MVTVARSDYSIYRSVLREIESDPALSLRLIVAGAHLSDEFGDTLTPIRDDGFEIAERVEMLRASDSSGGVARSMGTGIRAFADVFEARPPDILLVLGDRFEMHAAALAALPFKIPVAHIHGGELTEGAIDDALRHSMTKLSHLHFVATEEYASRVRQLGEEPWRVIVSGAPALDGIAETRLWTREEIISRLGSVFEQSPLLVTYHPVTLEHDDTQRQVEQLFHALDRFDVPIVFTAPNADTGGRAIRVRIDEFVRSRPLTVLVENLGALGYFSLMAYARAMVGNSSSGIIEAPSFGLPVVNIGTRQKGRIRAPNVLDVAVDSEAIQSGIRFALSSQFRESLRGLPNPYGSGGAARIIVENLKRLSSERLIPKRFCDLSSNDTSIAPALRTHKQ